MTTDITELAQSLKAAAEKATPGEWVYFPKNTSIEYDVGSDESQGSILYVDSGDFTQPQTDRNGEFIALANPANVLALVEALEKAQGMEAYWKTQCRGITDHCEELQARIAELDSRTVTAAAADVLAERQRQVTAEGWTAERDDGYQNSELADAAACYAIHAHNQGFSTPAHWPWSQDWWKQTSPRRDLVKAGALILAEIERLDRAAGIKVEAE
ncbi:TPA: ead/Ea22-like family protein [Klebsiella pneumoniae]|uniref:ead/Ea22-like family protein n=1 Tax=Klebsiella pneumoniae TaxID=573 RepID=UPI00165ECF8D|nr:ead/Ea22-like family protein [Klebsiella pneumoniae]MBC9992115.1 ead/Ea22-like family protein [Klebsiella pneumoniae]MBC9997422.1 ead/Ea22-like family protein [Klebsiella pneumoniae]HBQ2191452.1 ead/Ea22-like family protein [Klebsiella pneumoniae]